MVTKLELVGQKGHILQTDPPHCQEHCERFHSRRKDRDKKGKKEKKIRDTRGGREGFLSGSSRFATVRDLTHLMKE